ncbi:MAG: LapA family protein [Clostridia bacterium]|nr:LapA family protein [Clostridia bacterium]
MTWYLVVFLLFAFGVAVFAAQNGQTVDVRLLMWKMNTTLAVVVLGAAFAGAVITACLGAVAQLRLRWRLLRAENELRTLRQAVARAGVSHKPEDGAPPDPVDPQRRAAEDLHAEDLDGDRSAGAAQPDGGPADDEPPHEARSQAR